MNKKFLLHWLDGKTEEAQGTSISNAFTNSGYGAGAVPALDYYEEINETKKEQDEE